MRKLTVVLLLVLATSWQISGKEKLPQLEGKGSVIFLHPDGTGLGHRNILRQVKVGPDGDTFWDKMSYLAAYRVHQKGWLTTTSNAGATTHAFGKKVHPDSFGMDKEADLTSLSGKKSILLEAHEKRIPTGIVNSGHMAEPGTAVFLASSPTRKNTDLITLKMIESGVPLILNGGEALLLPEGVKGVHATEGGKRKDGRNLIEEAKKLGYTVIFAKEELEKLPLTTPKVLGVFAAGHTFNDDEESKVQAKGMPLYDPKAPTLAEMTKKAIEFLSHRSKQFFLVVEEEGTDNFGNKNNAAGVVEGLTRADDAIEVVMNYQKKNKNTLLICTADSDAGHPTIYVSEELYEKEKNLPKVTDNGAPLDGVMGEGSQPFWAKADAFGAQHGFGVAWATAYDMPGSDVAKFHGLNAHLLGPSVQNVDIYRIMYRTLFNKWP